MILSRAPALPCAAACGARNAAKPFSGSHEIGTKQTVYSVATDGSRVGSELAVKTLIFLSLAFVLAASVAVIATTSSPSSTRTENSAAYVY